MLKITVEVMTAREIITYFLTEDLRKEYKTELEKVNFTDDESIIDFLDNDAYGVERLTEEQCELLNIDYNDGYYRREV